MVLDSELPMVIQTNAPERKLLRLVIRNGGCLLFGNINETDNWSALFDEIEITFDDKDKRLFDIPWTHLFLPP